MRSHGDGEPGRWHALSIVDAQEHASIAVTPGQFVVKAVDERPAPSYSRTFEVSVNGQDLVPDTSIKR
ncbi:MAG: hypothetical protein ACI8QC_003116 [Planctomycetota bacterium]|jgi:hypothetical protein